MQKLRKGIEDYTFSCILESKTFGKVLVLTVQGFDLDVILEAVVQVLVATHVQLNVPEIFYA